MLSERQRAAEGTTWMSSRRMEKTRRFEDIHVAAKANVSGANVKRANASGRSHNVDVIKKDGED